MSCNVIFIFNALSRASNLATKKKNYITLILISTSVRVFSNYRDLYDAFDEAIA